MASHLTANITSGLARPECHLEGIGGLFEPKDANQYQPTNQHLTVSKASLQTEIEDTRPHFEHVALEEPSNQIRLIYIPFSESGRIDPKNLDCRLKTVDLTGTYSPFVALSYTWGVEDFSKKVSIDGQLMSISLNLWQFLYYFSSVGSLPSTTHVDTESDVAVSRWLWIDQICIDQSRTSERNHQVKLMSEIYKNSEHVIIWLGNPCTREHRPGLFRVAGMMGRYGYPKGALDDIARRKYWSRLWIVQEVMLAKNIIVLWGRGFDPWQWLRHELLNHPDHKGSALLTRKPIPTLLTNKFALHRALELFSHHECRDPRDKVYGLMGIVAEKERVDIDYSKTSAEVFWDTMAAFRTEKLANPDRILDLGRSMGVTGGEETCKGDALEKFQRLFDGKHPERIFQGQERLG